ncbi:uncharacterized protein LOC107225950 [Neodiprion lecontei]|uniref:Uncharacterized protein LOC107225950 n=1 Tax=Neodiprion lecontei TaxID=441921 RepID=A0ABM3G622_NEOLC|nr:uncharacterized protein LOC107225950 [Neodiprion lecontei]
MSINSLKALRKDLKVRYDISYILTRKLNRDSLENFFSQLRTRGALDDHPAPMNALLRIRMIVLGKNPGIVQRNTNTVDIAHDEYVVAKVLQRASISVPEPKLEIEVFLEVILRSLMVSVHHHLLLVAAATITTAFVIEITLKEKQQTTQSITWLGGWQENTAIPIPILVIIFTYGWQTTIMHFQTGLSVSHMVI